MTARAALAALVLLASAPAGAQVVYLGRADSSAGWTIPAYGPATARAPVNATYEAGVCGDATRLPTAGNGYAVVEAKGTWATADGLRAPEMTMQFWYKADGAPPGYCRLWSVERANSTLRRYGDSATLRWDDVSSCIFGSVSIDLWDGGWHKVRITAEHMADALPSNRKVYIDDTLAGSCPDSINGWGGFALQDGDELILGNNPEKDNGCPGWYDELQIWTTYDAQPNDYADEGACPSSYAPTVAVGGFKSQSWTTNTCTQNCSADWEVVTPEGVIVDSGFVDSTPVAVPVWFPSRYEGTTLTVRSACWPWHAGAQDCLDTGSMQDRGTLTTGSVTDLASAVTQRGRLEGLDDFQRPNTSQTANLLDPGRRVWTACYGDGGGRYLNIAAGAAHAAGAAGLGCYTTPLRHRDQWAVAYVNCSGADCTTVGSGNQELTVELRNRSGTFAAGSAQNVSRYRCKVAQGRLWWTKVGDADNDGLIDAGESGTACGTVAHGMTWPFWLRCEAYDDPADPARVVLATYTAPDSAGKPGAWSLKTTVYDKTATGTCNGTGGAWQSTGGPLLYDNGGIELAINKSTDQSFEVAYWGTLETNASARGVRRSHARTP